MFNRNDPVKHRKLSGDKGKESREKVVAPICGKITLPKEYIKTQKVTNGTKLITQSESPAPKLILVEKLRIDIYVNSVLIGETRNSVTPGKCITRKKRKRKSLALYPTRKDTIPNQDKII